MDCYILRSHLLGDGRIALERVEAAVAPRSGCVEDRCLPLYEVMHMSGHKSLVMVQRYSHLAPEFQERAIVALKVVIN